MNKKIENKEIEYELVVVSSNELDKSQVKSLLESIKKELTKAKAANISHKEMGVKDFAYPIDKKTSGLYNIFTFISSGLGLNDFYTYINRDKNILRYLLLKKKS